jgi:DNA-binding protein YbaB
VTAAKDLVTAQRERSRAQVEQYHQIRAALEKLRVRVSSADRSVRVELAAGGAIVDLRISEQAMDKSPDALAGAILEAIRLGLARVAERTAAEVEPLTGRRVEVSSVAAGRLPPLSTAALSTELLSTEPLSTEPLAAADVADAARFLPDED